MEPLNALVLRAQSGDLDAYGAVVRRFQDMAVGYAYAVLGDFHLAEDAAQEAFIEAYSSLSGLREPAAFPGWFRRIVFKHCDRLTRGRRVPTVPLESIPEMTSSDFDPAEALERSEMKDRVLRVIQALPERERAVTTLFYINGYSQDEIGEFLDVPAKTVKSRLHTARRRLRERMIDMVKERLHENAPSRDSRFADRVSRMIQPESMKISTYRYGVDEVDGNEAWALMCACAAGDAPRVQTILGKDPRLVNAQYWYQFPIHIAVREGHADVVRLLLEAGADPGQSRYTYNSWDKLLAVTKDRGHKDAQALLEAAIKQRFNYAPEFEQLKEAIKSRDRAQVEAILKGHPELVRASDALGNSSLHWAVLTRQLSLIDRFLELGADINTQRADGQTPAHVSINGDYWYRTRNLTPNSIRNTWAITGYLLAKGAYYTMTIAAALGDKERVEELLREDPGLAKRLDSGRGSPLYYAARFGYTHVVKLLLDYGADPNMPEDLAPRGRALFEAAAGNHLETARLLLERGADPNAEVDSSGSCLTIVDAKHPETCRPMQELLRQYGAITPPWVLSVEEMKAALREGAAVIDHEQFLHELLEKADPELIDVLLKERPDLVRRLTLTDIWGGSCPRDPGSLRKLLDHGFDPNRPNWIGRTFLHRAAERGDIEIARILLEYGADIDAVELESGGTPLAAAAREGQVEMVRFLIERGADPAVPTESPWATPLAWAEKKGHREIADILRKHGAKA